MNPLDIRTLHLLEEIEKNHSPSQRQLARQLDISLGLVNSFLKRLASKGYFKVTHIPKNRVKYILTPKGMAEKSRLTYEYIKLSYAFFKDVRKKIQKLLKDLENQGVSRVVFIGATDLAEIAYISLHETEIQLTAILDDRRVGKKFFNHTVQAGDRTEIDHLRSYSSDHIRVWGFDAGRAEKNGHFRRPRCHFAINPTCHASTYL